MKTDNEIIAEFMGWRLDIKKGSKFWIRPDGSTFIGSSFLLFDTSWDWLMPVVQKFFIVMETWDDKVLGNIKRGIIERVIWDTMYNRKTIADVANVLSDEIKWYNQHTT